MICSPLPILHHLQDIAKWILADHFPPQAGSQSDELFCEASRLTDEETGKPRLESAQSRLIQVLYLLMSCRFNHAWYAFGHALQIISALGLHRRDDPKRPLTAYKQDYIEDQCRKRTFWVAYILDKYLGVVFGKCYKPSRRKTTMTTRMSILASILALFTEYRG